MLAFNRRVHQAIDLAARAHASQVRKDPDLQIPYVAHVFGVACLLAEFGLDEDVCIAGLLHDVLEDQPAFFPEVAAFGEGVVSLVREVSEQKLDTSGNERPWVERKAGYIDKIRTASHGAKAISCADKIHNMQSMLLALERGADIWQNMQKASPADQLDRFHRVAGALDDGWDHPLLARFRQVLAELERRLSGKAVTGDRQA